ncbi:MAG TPA: glycosyltransferase [Clostridiales bacterium]|nr:glycosyltransferase [Clostridiales bacterium]
MKVLFLSVTAGQGHNQTGKAAMECLLENNVECEMLDTFEYINPILKKSISQGYLISTKLTPALYGRMYRLAEKLEKNNIKMSVSKLVSSIYAKKLTTYIDEYQPDVIVCTHIFSAQILTQIKNMGLSARTIGIVTDYTIHPFWEETDLDYYIIANELLIRQAVKKGLPEERLKPIGIPIFKKFSRKIPVEEARAALNIDNKDTILVMSGSMGYGKVARIIKQLDSLDKDFQIISVCGNNEALRQKIDEMEMQKKVYNFGFVDNVDIMMDAANCIITKPGGLTVSESMAKGLPMAIVNPIPGQEDRNTEFLLNNGLAMKITSTFPIDEAVYHLLSMDEIVQTMIERINSMARPNASEDLCKFILNLHESEKVTIPL